MNENNFDKKTNSRLLSKLYADKYFIINNKDVFRIVNKIQPKKTFYLEFNRKFNTKVISDYIVVIGQSLLENNLINEHASLVSHINILKKKNKVIFVKHPRQKLLNNINCDVFLDGYNKLIEYIEKNGKPKLVIAVSSSLLIELKQFNLNCKRIFISKKFDKEKLTQDYIKIKTLN